MKQQRFTTALLNENPSTAEQIIRWVNENLLFAIASVVTILMIVATLFVVLATPPAQALPTATDYDDHAVSEQISADWERKAKVEWVSEFGDAPPNLSVEAQEYLEKQTVRKQAELNQRKGKENG